MTDKQLEIEEKKLRELMKLDGYGWIDGKYIKPPKMYEDRGRELSCISMINSILAYNWFGQTAEDIMLMEERGYKNYLAEYVELFGRKYVVMLIEKQMDDIDHIERNVFTDGEGLTYNSIVWKEVA